MTMSVVNSRLVVVRFRDGRMVKGTTHDFFPNKTEFHVYEGGDESQRAVKVPLVDLKAVFFVKNLKGDPRHKKGNAVADAPPQGRRLAVRFEDGEELVGSSMGYNASKPGFFLSPADTDGNNTRVYVVSAAVEDVRFL